MHTLFLNTTKGHIVHVICTLLLKFYLAALGLSCDMRNLKLEHVGSSSLTRIELWPPALEAQSHSHWTTREVPVICFFHLYFLMYS